MTHELNSLEGSTGIVSPPDKFYGFFKNDMSELVNIIPDSFKSVELIKGEDGTVGSVKRWTYSLGGVTLSVALEIEALDDAAPSITFKAVEGDVLQLYKSYKFTIAPTVGSVKWTIEYEKAFLAAPPPEAYIAFALMTSKLVDLYLVSH